MARPAAAIAWMLGGLTLALAAPLGARPVPLRGVIEGYYGRPWTGAARRDVIRFLGRHGMNVFVYAPKNDDFHRARWREPYPDDALADLARSAQTARHARVTFVYALSPVLDVCYACDADFTALTAKLAQVARARVRRFALLFDDGGRLSADEDVARYGGSDLPALARAQADLTNRVQRWLRRHGRGRVSFLVPSLYAGTLCLPYHEALDRALARGLPVAWTGSAVIPAIITSGQAAARAACLPRHPLVLWDNYPVNDTFLSNSLHLGPLSGRDAELPARLHGYLLNPMTQAHASLVALGTAAAYLRRPASYDAEQAWRDALAELDPGGSGFAVLAAQVRSSALDLDDARELAAAVDAVSASFAGADWTAAVDDLEAEETRQAAAPDDVRARLAGTPLGVEIAPWVDELARHVARGLEAVRLLRALKPALRDLSATPGAGSVRVRGRALPPDATVAAELGSGFDTEALGIADRIATPGPVLTAYGQCLVDPFGADIHFCPEFGLNVHGKALYLLLGTTPALLVGRNVHDRLVMLAGAAYAEWSAHRSPGADDLLLTLGGTPVALAPDGAFDATVGAPGGRIEVLLRTAAGEATRQIVP